jgi:tRNA threonylcarbamoyladenosine biosynthesis protein TsaB
MWVLGIETATDLGGAGLIADQEPAVEVMFGTGRRHIELLPGAIQGALDLAGIKPEKLDLLAVDIGPGSFTGLRIGIAFAKAMAQSLNIPLVGIRQAEAVGLPLTQWWPGRVTVWIHDRRDFVYVASVTAGRAGKEALLRVEEASAKAEGLIVGTGAITWVEVIRRAAPTATVAGELLAYPRPVEIARQGRLKFQDRGPDDPLALEPHYVQKEEQ